MFQILNSIVFSFAALGSIPSTQFSFETTLATDRDFVKKNQTLILDRAKQVEAYWGIHPGEKISVAIQPFSENPFLFQCSRIYDSNRIYAQSPDSLKHLNGPQRKSFSQRCISAGYPDLTATIIHEYVHILHLRYVGSGPNPARWVWEGAAQYLARQVKSDATKRAYAFSLRDFDSINLCERLPSEELTNEIGGLAVSFYENSKPHVLLSLAKAHSAKDVKQVLQTNKLPCILTKEDLLGELNRSVDTKQISPL